MWEADGGSWCSSSRPTGPRVTEDPVDVGSGVHRRLSECPVEVLLVPSQVVRVAELPSLYLPLLQCAQLRMSVPSSVVSTSRALVSEGPRCGLICRPVRPSTRCPGVTSEQGNRGVGVEMDKCPGRDVPPDKTLLIQSSGVWMASQD